MPDNHKKFSALSLPQHMRRSALATAISLSLLGPAQAIFIQVDNAPCTLINAITSANSNSAIGGCTAGDSGSDTLVLQNSSVQSLTAVDNASGLINPSANGLPLITSAITIAGNGSTIERGGINPPKFRLFEVNQTGSLTLIDVTLSNGLMKHGGAIYNTDGTVTLVNSILSNNTADTGQGGAIYSMRGVMTLANTTISGNIAGTDGGGIFSDDGALSLSNTIVSGNIAGRDGGGIFLDNVSATLNNSTLSSNRAVSGGGLLNQGGDVSLESCTVSDNSASFSGGGLANYDNTVTLNNSTISGNRALLGGGLFLYRNGAARLINSTVSGNSVSISGGGMHLKDGNVILINSTVTKNRAVNSGAALHLDSFYTNTAIIMNTIIAGHPQSDACRDHNNEISLPFVHNWFEDDSCGGIARGDPGIGGLANNGGPTKTHALFTGSGAIDNGRIETCANPLTVNNLDQRGVARPVGDRCDLGAFEGSVDEPSFIVIPLPGGKTAVIPL